MTATAPQQKITYTSTNVDMEAFHRAFDAALAEVRVTAGKSYPLYINGQAVEVKGVEPITDVSPIDTSLVLGKFACATPAHVDQAVRGAKAAQKGWAALPWRERVRILRRAAELIRERKFLLSAIMAYEVGKNRLESMGDTEESADLIDYYCQQVEDHNGFTVEMAKMTPIERNTEILRPYGVFVCIAPFNFPLALSTGMSSAALMSGNAVVYKPAEDTPWTGLKLYEVYRDAGVPAGVFQFVSGHGREIGDPMWQHPLTDGVVFTGSKPVGMRIFHGLSEKWVKPCLMELGGKNAAIVMDTADLDAAAEGVMKSAFGLQNQKCSATSRVYVHRKVAAPFMEKLIEKTRAIRMGDVTQRDVWFGPVINEKAVQRWEKAVNQAGREGKVVLGGQRLRGEAFEKGHFVAPTIAELPLESTLFLEELFAPFLAVATVDSFDQAIAESNKVEFGLTAGLFSGRQEEIDRFFDEVEAGVCYVNKRSGATTGAWPGAQAFCGWKGSGGSGKGGCGPWYVQQFMREQSRTVVTS
ncbi:MAG: aldehyde dehydrogenase family protein [Gemmatimonadota bacterium]|nr:aldehyde dehydrogenase family protein [Gemmatimonadota bacterium]